MSQLCIKALPDTEAPASSSFLGLQTFLPHLSVLLPLSFSSWLCPPPALFHHFTDPDCVPALSWALAGPLGRFRQGQGHALRMGVSGTVGEGSPRRGRHAEI